MRRIKQHALVNSQHAMLTINDAHRISLECIESNDEQIHIYTTAVVATRQPTSIYNDSFKSTSAIPNCSNKPVSPSDYVVYLYFKCLGHSPFPHDSAQ